MFFATSPARSIWAARLRLGVLIVVAWLVSHTAIFVAQFGAGGDLAQAMAAGGHDGWWLPVSLAILSVGFVLLLSVLGVIGRLEATARRLPSSRDEHPRFQGEMLSIWGRLFPIVTILFAVQENIEQLAAHGRLIGIEALVGPGYPLALPVLALVTIALAALGALIRWRIAVLQTRIAKAEAARRQRVASQTIAPRWRVVGALSPRRWLLDRLDAGRSPPWILPA